MLATLTVALSACAGDNRGSSSGGTSASTVQDTGAAAASTSGDDGQGGSGTQTSERSSITIAIPQDIDSMDPHTAVAAGTREVLFNVFEGLVKPDENGDLIPAVASEWTISDDATVYTFTIRENMKYHDGTLVTPQDVVYSITRCMDDATASPYQSGLSSIETVEVNDADEVVITLSAPDSEFLTQLTCAVIPEAVADPEASPTGTGPYRYVSRAPRQNVILEKFDDYWDTENAAQIRHVELKIEADTNTIAMGLESGAIDMFCRLTPE
ncbi:MAG: ABC transporter substrate-binding protein, partial [Lachnospiraceae bacterium]|nr:ABC transporter substrate-binding protein [Lachnospiraceae bacterium]